VALQDYYNEWAHIFDSIGDIRENLGEQFKALVDYNHLLLEPKKIDDIGQKLHELVSKLDIPARYKDELLKKPPEPQENLEIERNYLLD